MKSTKSSSDSDYVPDEVDVSMYRNYGFYAQYIEYGMRIGLSNNQLANLNNCLMRDKNVEDPSEYISHEKVRKCKEKHVFDLLDEHKKKTTGLKVLGNVQISHL